MKIKMFLLSIIVISGTVSRSSGQDISVCLMSPPYLKLQVPVHGFTSQDSNFYIGSCNAPVDSLWMRQSANSFDLLVAADGPAGSGRYWNVTIGLAELGQTPLRGICLSTTTVGWRTLQDFSKLPLPWVADRDADGRPEIIIWDSFPLHDEASLAEFGLIAWAYEYTGQGVFNINWQISREITAEIASAYRKPIKGTGDRIQSMRIEIARHLEKFASKKCMVREQSTH